MLERGPALSESEARDELAGPVNDPLIVIRQSLMMR
jgi:hypothetical protein